jgi:hypothetical protein
VASGSTDRTNVNLIDPATGELKFDKYVRTRGGLLTVKPVASGILFVTDRELNIVNPSTGTTVLPDAVGTGRGLYAIRGSLLFSYAPKDKAIYAVHLEKGKSKVLTKEKISFEGREEPTRLEVRDDGVLLMSSQNVALFKKDGSKVYQKYFPAPRDPAILRALNYANAVYAAYAGAVYGLYGAAFTEASAQAETGGESELYGAIGQGLSEGSKQAMSFAGDKFREASARYKATEQTRDYAFILAKLDKGHALLQVNKASGGVMETIDMGKDKKPSYAVDNVAGKLYYRRQPTAIECYAFQ